MIYNVVNNHKQKWIVLIHCICGNEKIFNAHLDTLNNIYNLIIIRLPGHEINSELYEATIGYVTEEIHDFLIKNNIKKIDIFGISLGAMIASEFTTRYTQKVEKAFLIAPCYGFTLHLFSFGYTLLMKVKRFIPKKLYMFFITYTLLPGKNESEQRKRLYNGALKMDKYFLYQWMEEMDNFFIKGKERISKISNIPSNVYLLYGNKDKVFLGYTKRNLKDMSIFYTIKGAGHLCNIDMPNLINNLLEEEKT